MGFDTESGELRFDDSSLTVGPKLARALVEDPASGFTPLLANGPHASFHRSARLDDTPFSVVVWFEEDVLVRVSLTVDDPSVAGTSWADYEPERVRRFHDDWVTARVGETQPWNPSSYPYGGIERELAWGSIGSYLHPQDSGATITITYTR